MMVVLADIVDQFGLLLPLPLTEPLEMGTGVAPGLCCSHKSWFAKHWLIGYKVDRGLYPSCLYQQQTGRQWRDEHSDHWISQTL